MHPRLISHPEFKGQSGGGVYSDTLAELDFRSGQVLDAIDRPIDGVDGAQALMSVK